jgi:four helix bundle protein
MKNFRELKVWHKAHALVLRSYAIVSHLPKDELYGLTSQVRRASTSIAANIAEACGRNSDADFTRLLTISMGSASELEYLFILAEDLSFLDPKIHKEVEPLVIEVKKMLYALIIKLRPKDR